MSQDSPSINSTRILRAYRLNNVENAKLKNTLFVLDKSKRREMRLANQDIRLINLTLDYINSSSGHSPEGLPPNYVETTKREESSPMFMYGERLVSRKFGKKFRRVQSAHVGLSRKDSAEDLANQESGDAATDAVTDSASAADKKGKARPKSSPAKQLTTFTGLRRSRSLRQKSDKSGSGRGSGSDGKPAGTDGTRSTRRSSSVKHQTEETAGESEPLTAVAIETAREHSALNGGIVPGDNTTESAYTRIRSNEQISASLGNKTQNGGVPTAQNGTAKEESLKAITPIYLTDANDGDQSPELGMTDRVYTPIIRRPKSKPRSQNQDRKQEMTRKVKEAREQVLQARKSKPDPTQAWALPASNPHKQQAIMDLKKNMNLDKNHVIQERLKEFMHSYPVRKY